ncbi:MAG: outer membrane beta-barrel protein [Bacteroidota bacterium]|nr:outer membrane beta-barrel protein [Bacteroidota bacterium]
MDKNLHNIEDLFKKGLEGNEESPSEEVWNAIDQSLEKANSLKFKRKYYSLKRATAVLIVILALLSIYVLRNESKKQIESNKKNENIFTSEPTLKKSSNSEPQSSTENKTINKAPADNQPAITENLSSKKESITENTKQQPLNNSTESLNTQKTNLSNTTEIDNVKKSPEKAIQKRKVQAESIQPVANLEDKNEIVFQSQEQLATPPPVNFVSNENLTFNSIDFLKDVTKITPYRLPERIAGANTIIHFPKPLRFTAGIFYSPNIPFSHLRDEDHHFGNPYSSELEKKESGTYSYSFGLSVGYRLNYKWSLQSGVNFSTTNMHIEPEKIYAERDNQGVVKYTINTSSGKGYILPSFSSNPRVGDSLFTQNIKHSLKYTAIPLAVKYNLSNGRFSANLLAGLSTNILSTGKISTEVKRGNESELDKTHDIHGLRTLYFSGLAGIGFDYNIYKNLSFTFSPIINFAIDPINKNVPVRSYPGTVNFQFGLKTSLF